jgi:hypothetical protein
MWIYNYYTFLSQYHRDPVDLHDFFDGLNSFSARNRIEYLASGGK